MINDILMKFMRLTWGVNSMAELNKEENVAQEDQLEETLENQESAEVEEEHVDDQPEDDKDESIEVKYQQLEAEKTELFEKYLRLQAEYDNYRKRTQREKAADLTYKSQKLATELLPVIDNFERALQTASDDEAVKSFFEGMEMIYRNLLTVLEAEGIEVIPAVGEVFDPTMHQAVMQVQDDQYDSNIVVEELQKGYRLKDRVLRPAMVKVNQ